VCDPIDAYEVGSYGDSSADPIDEWTAILDDGLDTITIVGNLLDDDEEDWYIISAEDDVAQDIAEGRDEFKFEVDLTGGVSAYNMVVYHEDSLAVPECPALTGYTEYSWYIEDVGDAPLHGIPADPQACATSSILFNECENNSADFFVLVTRNAAEPASCASYELTVTNGVW
jgi:hypothetical protein